MADDVSVVAVKHRLREVSGRTLAIVLLAALAIAIGRAYLGHSSGPYGVCYGSSGRSIPCEVAKSGK